MLCTPWRSTSSATLNALASVMRCSETSFRRSFGMTTSESTCLRSSEMPFSACSMRRLPSNANGFVTMPTVSAPISFAISATIGAAPVPVPPPMPAVTKTMSAPLSVAAISSRLSSAAFAPTSGFEPAPLPWVFFSPICTRVFACERESA